MADETTRLINSQPSSGDDAKNMEDTENGGQKSHVDRMFLLVALLGMQVELRSALLTYIWQVLTRIRLLGIFLAAADDSFVLVTHGEIGSHFKRVPLGPWLITVYNLGYMATLPLYGRLSDVYGYRSILLVAYVMFSAGCAVTGTASVMWVAIAGRLLSGVGASGMLDLISVIINDKAPPREIALIRSYLGVAFPLGLSCGGPLGGVLTDTIGWRWSFLIQVPMGLLCFCVSYWKLSPPEKNESKGKKEYSTRPEDVELNLFGIFSLGILITGVMMLLQTVGEGNQNRTMLLITLGVIMVSGIAFGLNEQFWTQSPLMPLGIITNNYVWAIYLIQFLIYFPAFGVASNIGEFLVRTRNATNRLNGVSLIYLPVGSILGSVISGYIMRYTGKYRSLLFVSWAVLFVGTLLIMLRLPQGAYLGELAYLGLLAIGFMGLNSALFVAMSVSVPKDKSAAALTTYYLVQQLGMLVGVISTASLTQNTFKSYLVEKLAGESNWKEIIRNVLQDNRFAFTHLPDKLQGLVVDSYQHAFFFASLLCVLAVVVSFPALCLLPQKPLE
ncbi:transporter [Penicillium argentinense]|uniref:Transporter n=1 Tax=Penicillium argentinense TaxID=1131581 RepID=A0A9W9G182_9EURO|nr:transporter [Penicillium argentinense]KAJ5109745.1 transporter [Penicillium argentinense]